jgi:hypothetical protein
MIDQNGVFWVPRREVPFAEQIENAFEARPDWIVFEMYQFPHGVRIWLK